MREGIKRLLALLLALSMCVPAWAADVAGTDEAALAPEENAGVSATVEETEDEAAGLAETEEAGADTSGAETAEEAAEPSDEETDAAEGETLDAPVLQGAATATEQDNAGTRSGVVQVVWTPVEGAARYEVLRKTGSGDWETAGYATAEDGAETVSYSDYEVELYQTYTYTVRCLDSSDQAVSSYDETGVSAYYPSGSCGDSVSWQLTEGGVLEISGQGPMDDGYNVELTPWYMIKDEITAAQVGEGITFLSSYAFQGCTNLTSVTLPESLTGLGQYAFLNCTGLTSVVIPDGVTELPERVFYSCTGLETVTLPAGLTSIGKGAFDGCSSLTGLELPDTVTEIGASAFGDCASLTELTIPQGVTSLGLNTFYGCTGLEQIILPEGLTELGMYALASCTSLTELELPASLTSIGRGAFSNCTALETVTFLGSAPETVTSWFGSTACVAVIPSGNQESWLALDLSAAGTAVSWKVLDEATGALQLIAPTLTSAVYGTDGVTLAWEPVTGAASYRILRKSAGEESWTVLGETEETSWLDGTVQPKTAYTYTVRAVDELAVEGLCDAEGLTVDTTLTGTCGDGLTWTLEDGTLTISGQGSLYDYESGQTPWASWESQITAVMLSDGVTGLGDNAFSGCTALEAVWFSGNAPATAENVFPSQGLTVYYPANDSWTAELRLSLGENLTWVAWSPASGTVQPCATPVLTVAGAVGGVRVTWSAVAGAEGYAVFRWNDTKGSWTRLGTTSTTTWLDTGAASGTTCRYTVRCLQGGSYASAYDRQGQSLYYLAAPQVTVANSASGVTISWNKVDGAKSYAVYRKTAGSGWSRIATLYTSLGYVDKTASSGVSYYYTVRVYAGSQSSAYRTDITIRYLAQPTVQAANTASGVRVTWSESAGAQSYLVYRKTSSSGWQRVAQVSGLSWTDQTAQSGTTYTYTVRAHAGGTLSSYSSGARVLYLTQPTPTVYNGSKGVNVSWTKTAGATGYRIYRKTPGGSWQRIATVQGGSTLSYTDTAVKSKNGTTYLYTVRAVSGSTLSSYHSGKTIVRLTAPTLRSVTVSGAGKLKVQWSTNSKGTGYQITYATNSGFSNATTVTVTSASTASRVLSGLSKNKTYYVRIRAVFTGDGVTSYSAWSSTVKRYIS